MTHPTPDLIYAQKKGHELPNQQTKVEYQLQTQAGAIAASFEDEITAREYVKERDEKWAHKVAKVTLFRVTTITEKLS